ncbi:MAG: DUF4388 domain-containing protein [Proteobacteria bacterium]|nr:DUF4388 domain-containing protein [Pseudomonadota bacterium]
MNQNQGNSNTAAQGAVLDPTMSLVGRLEDLSLGEILQIVSLSNRSGLLRIESPGDRASIYIRGGKVVYASRSDEKEGLFSHLMHHGLVEKSRLESLRGEMDGLTSADKVRDFLQERMGITSEVFLRVLKTRVEELVYSLFHWEEGTFSFQLIDEEKHKVFIEKVAPFFLEQGIPCQFLVMEGARRRDEMGRTATERGPSSEGLSPKGKTEEGKPEESFVDDGGGFDLGMDGQNLSAEEELEEFRVPEAFPPPNGMAHGTVVMIGLKGVFAEAMVNSLRSKGVTPLIHQDGADGLGRIQELRKNRITPILAMDLEASGITDGRRFGGLEILSTLWDLGFYLPVVLFYRDQFPETLRDKLQRVPGLKCLSSPAGDKAEDIASDIVEAALRGVPEKGEEVPEGSGEDTAAPEGEERALASSASPPEAKAEVHPGGLNGEPPGYYDIQGEMVEELDGVDLSFKGWEEEPEIPPEHPLDPHMAQLSSYVQELNRQDISGEITLLALRFASVFMSRGVLFLVRKEDLKGLGQFGVDLGGGKDPDAVVRSLVLPSEGFEPFARVIVRQQSYKGPPTGSETEKGLFEALGGEIPSEIYLGPIISMGKVAVLLYGDDVPGDRVIEPVHTLDIFLSHVGLALDRAFLEMKLKTRRP